MTTHPDHLSMLRESLPQFVELARRGIVDPVLGYPSTALLLCVVDIIAGYIPPDHRVSIRGVAEPQLVAGTGWLRFNVLNHRFFEFRFDMQEIQKIYLLSRSPLVHNGVVPFGVELTVTRPVPGGIEIRPDGSVLISLPDLTERCDAAVKAFLAEVDDLVPCSRAARDLYEKVNTKEYAELRSAAESGKPWIESASASAIGPPPEPPPGS